MNAKLYVKYGVMSSGKSTFLLMDANNFDTRNIGVLCFKPSIDDRDGVGVIKSRIGISRDCVMVQTKDNMYDIVKKYISENEKKPTWILVDECQFLTKEQVAQLRDVVDDFNINVKCYGLRTDFQTHLFEGMQKLFEMADNIDEMKISCDCGRKAIFNARFNEKGEIVTSGEQILIGGDDLYKPICSKCYKEAIKKLHSK